MQTLWFILVAFMLTMYVVLDGFDLGAGVMHLFAARDDLERRTINEMWKLFRKGLTGARGRIAKETTHLYLRRNPV